MKKTLLIALVVMVLSAVLLSACGGGGGGATETVYKDPPAEYAGKTNPVKGDQAAIDAGKAVYTQNCESCHGSGGKGDGPAGSSLDPKPADLTAASASASDAFLFWVVNEGGAAAELSASMAAYKGVLSEDEIWQVLAYVSTLK